MIILAFQQSLAFTSVSSSSSDETIASLQASDKYSSADLNQKENSIPIIRSAISNIQILNSVAQSSSLVYFSETIFTSLLQISNITITDSSISQSKVFEFSPALTYSTSSIKNMTIKNVTAMRTCFVQKVTDHNLKLNVVNIANSTFSFANFLQVKRSTSSTT